MLTEKDMRLMLEIIAQKVGRVGYSEVREEAQLQAKLSIMLEARLQVLHRSEDIINASLKAMHEGKTRDKQS